MRLTRKINLKSINSTSISNPKCRVLRLKQARARVYELILESKDKKSIIQNQESLITKFIYPRKVIPKSISRAN